MARKPRFVLPGVPQHVIQRGNNRSPCFFSTEDYQAYLDYLGEAAERYGCLLHAYVLMTNHVHLLVTPVGEYGISHMIQRLGQRYVRYINITYQRTGTLWEGRYKASLVESERYLLTCQRYIELNPVRAKMVESPADYRWSSYRVHAYGEADERLAPHQTYVALGRDDLQRQEAYRELFSGHLETRLVHEIRNYGDSIPISIQDIWSQINNSPHLCQQIPRSYCHKNRIELRRQYTY